MNRALTQEMSTVLGAYPLKLDVAAAGPSEIATLTRAMVRGEEAAWVHFHTEYSGRIRRYLLVLTRGEEDRVADLLQVVFSRIARHIRSFHDESVLWNWVARIARTVVIDELRRNGTRQALLARIESSQSAPSGEEGWPEFLAEGLEKIEPEYRHLLTRKYFDGTSVRALAAAEGTSEKAIESKLVRARQKLRETIKGLLQREE